MYRAYKFRMYPTDTQKELINKTFGCTRFVYNYFLNECKEKSYQKAFEMCKKLKELEKENKWLKEVDATSLRCSIFNLEDSYKNFFAKRSGYPKFKNRFEKQRYRTSCIRSSYKGKEYSNLELDLKMKKIKLPKLGLISIRGYRNLKEIPGKLINATIEKEKYGKYYVSVIYEEKEIEKIKVVPRAIIGIDLGLKDIVVTSDGDKYSNEKELAKREKQLKRYQRKLSRQIKGSKNYNKTKIKIARLHNKIANGRKHNIIEIVNKLVKENDIIVSEKLKVKEMIKKHPIAKSIQDASFNKICEMIKWKSKCYGKYYYQIDSYYPSSKTCNHCGEKTEKTKSLNIREWECERCENKNDRDINASINIMYEGLKLHFG